jgi:hypothetical protein
MNIDTDTCCHFEKGSGRRGRITEGMKQPRVQCMYMEMSQQNPPHSYHTRIKMFTKESSACYRFTTAKACKQDGMAEG